MVHLLLLLSVLVFHLVLALVAKYVVILKNNSRLLFSLLAAMVLILIHDNLLLMLHPFWHSGLFRQGLLLPFVVRILLGPDSRDMRHLHLLDWAAFVIYVNCNWLPVRHHLLLALIEGLFLHFIFILIQLVD